MAAGPLNREDGVVRELPGSDGLFQGFFGVLQGAQGILFIIGIVDVRFATPEFVDGQIVVHNDNRLKSPTGSFGFSSEIENIEHRIAKAIILDAFYNNFKSTTFIFSFQAALNAYIQVLLFDSLIRHKALHDIKIVENFDIGGGIGIKKGLRSN